MTVLTWPSDLVPTEMEWYLQRGDGGHVSPTSGAEQHIVRANIRWVAALSFPRYRDDRLLRLEALMAQIGDPENQVLIPKYGQTNRGSYAGTPVIDGGSQTGKTLKLRNLTANETNIARVGDFIGIDNTGQVVKATDNADSDTNGIATIPIQPFLRSAPADGTGITTDSPTVKFKNPIDNKRLGGRYMAPAKGQLNFTLIEVLPWDG